MRKIFCDYCKKEMKWSEEDSNNSYDHCEKCKEEYSKELEKTRIKYQEETTKLEKKYNIK